MNTYEWHGQKFWAWSKMNCSDTDDHQPHTGNWEYTTFGPYYCEGVNPTVPYQPKHRADV